MLIWTKEEDEYLIQNYNKIDIKKIAKKIHRSELLVLEHACWLGIEEEKYQNLPLEKKSSAKRYKGQHALPYGITIKYLIEKYNELQSIRKVGDLVGMKAPTIGYYLHKGNAIVRKRNEKIKCNEDFFSYDTPESFYWAGFIAADGCVKTKKKYGYKSLSIDLAECDKVHLEKFKKAIGFEGEVHTYSINTGGRKSEMCITSDKVFDDLARFNIVPRKSLILTFPEWLINHPLVNHFMRGYNDGDGSFYVQKPKGGRTAKQLMFSLRGTEQFLSTYKAILEERCVLKSNKDRKIRISSGMHTLEYGGNGKLRKICDFLYKDYTVDIVLDRKFNMAFSPDFKPAKSILDPRLT